MYLVNIFDLLLLQLDDLFITENTAALANARSELAGAQLRADGLQSQVSAIFTTNGL